MGTMCGVWDRVVWRAVAVLRHGVMCAMRGCGGWCVGWGARSDADGEGLCWCGGTGCVEGRQGGGVCVSAVGEVMCVWGRRWRWME